MNSQTKKKAPAATGAIENRNSNNLLEEENTMTTSLTENVSVVESDMTLGALNLVGVQTAIKTHVGESPQSLTTISLRSLIPMPVLSQNLRQTRCDFTIRELGNLAEALDMTPLQLITQPVRPADMRPCSREECEKDEHDFTADNLQGDMCTLPNIESNTWQVGACSVDVESPWVAWVDLTRCDEIEGAEGVQILKAACVAFEAMQKRCNELNDREATHAVPAHA